MLMPSMADLIFMGLLCVLVFTPLSVRLLGDAGIGWHIRAGQQILATHSIPRTDSFSSTMSGKAWFAWEWLYDVKVGWLEHALGLNGVVWFTAVVIGTVFALTFRLLILRQSDVLVAFILVLLAMSASMVHFLARPHVLSWLFTLIWFWLLDSSERACFDEHHDRGTRQLWLLPPLMLVWANAHGGFLVGFALLGFFFVGAVWNWFGAKQDRLEDSLRKIAAGKQARNLALVGLLSATASLMNPYRWHLHEHIYSYLTNRFLMDHIDEFQSPNFHGVAQRCFLGLLLFCVAVLLTRRRAFGVSEGLTVLFAIYAGLYASRNIPVSSILLVMIVAPVTPGVPVARSFLRRMGAVEYQMRGHLWPILAAAVTFGIAANGGRLGANSVMDAHFDARRMPVAAVNDLEKHQWTSAVLSPDYWGGYLIYRLHPAMQVVVDDRHDLYGDEFLKSYLKMMHVERGWDEFLRSQKVSCVLLPRDAALANVLVESHEWRSIYADDVAIVFVRAPGNP